MALALCCSLLALIGAFFFGCLFLMAYNGNQVLLLKLTRGNDRQTLLAELTVVRIPFLTL